MRLRAAVITAFAAITPLSACTERAGEPFPETPVALTVADSTVTLGGTTFGPYIAGIDPNTKVGIARFPAQNDPRADLVLNLFMKDFWGDRPFTSQDVASAIRASHPEDSIYAYVVFDSVTDQPSFYVRRFAGGARDGSAIVSFTRIWDYEGDAVAVTFGRAVAGGARARAKWADDSLVVWAKQLERLRPDGSWRARFAAAAGS